MQGSVIFLIAEAQPPMKPGDLRDRQQNLLLIHKIEILFKNDPWNVTDEIFGYNMRGKERNFASTDT